MRFSAFTVVWTAPFVASVVCAAGVAMECRWGLIARAGVFAACGLCGLVQVCGIGAGPVRPLRHFAGKVAVLAAFAVALDLALGGILIAGIGLISLQLTGLEGIF